MLLGTRTEPATIVASHKWPLEEGMSTNSFRTYTSHCVRRKLDVRGRMAAEQRLPRWVGVEALVSRVLLMSGGVFG